MTSSQTKIGSRTQVGFGTRSDPELRSDRGMFRVDLQSGCINFPGILEGRVSLSDLPLGNFTTTPKGNVVNFEKFRVDLQPASTNFPGILERRVSLSDLPLGTSTTTPKGNVVNFEKFGMDLQPASTNFSGILERRVSLSDLSCKCGF